MLNFAAGYHQERLNRQHSNGGGYVFVEGYVKQKFLPGVSTNDLELICIKIEPLESNFLLVTDL